MHEPVTRHLQRRGRSNETSVSSGAGTSLVRGVLMEWRKDELAPWVSMPILAMNAHMPFEVVMDVLGIVVGEGSPLKGHDFRKGGSWDGVTPTA